MMSFKGFAHSTKITKAEKKLAVSWLADWHLSAKRDSGSRMKRLSSYNSLDNEVDA